MTEERRKCDRISQLWTNNITQPTHAVHTAYHDAVTELMKNLGQIVIVSLFAVIIYVLHLCLGGIGVKQHGKNNRYLVHIRPCRSSTRVFHTVDILIGFVHSSSSLRLDLCHCMNVKRENFLPTWRRPPHVGHKPAFNNLRNTLHSKHRGAHRTRKDHICNQCNVRKSA